MNEPQQVFRDRVRERDLDNFLVEELRASNSFREWFLSHLPLSSIVRPIVRFGLALTPTLL